MLKLNQISQKESRAEQNRPEQTKQRMTSREGQNKIDQVEKRREEYTQIRANQSSGSQGEGIFENKRNHQTTMVHPI